MFNPSSVNVICFDPNHNSDQARGYAAKYCSKPEKWYRIASKSRRPNASTFKKAYSRTSTRRFYVETQQENGRKAWLQGRVVGL